MSAGGILSVSMRLNPRPAAGGEAKLAERIRQAFEEAGEACARAAKARAPVRTGRLRDSISWRILSDGSGGSGGLDGLGGLTAAVGTDVPYAAAQELGTRTRPGRHYLADGAAEAWKK